MMKTHFLQNSLTTILCHPADGQTQVNERKQKYNHHGKNWKLSREKNIILYTQGVRNSTPSSPKKSFATLEWASVQQKKNRNRKTIPKHNLHVRGNQGWTNFKESISTRHTVATTYVVKLSFSSCRLSPSWAYKPLSACPSPGPVQQWVTSLIDLRLLLS